jgi:arabinofuranosyltransferase
VTALVLLVPPALLLVLGWRHRWMAEDGFIYLRVVEHVLAGHGPVFNVGERVEIYTSPLWLGLLSAVAAALPRVAPERIAVAAGLAASLLGLLAAERGALRLAGGHRGGAALPLGALVVAVLPPYRDFATSGLETALVFAWLGTSFLGLSRVLLDGRGSATALAALLGLGPLVRPDLAIVSGGFLCLVLATRLEPWSAAPRLCAAAAALPLGYQALRMGYFASLVPGPALAKRAFDAHWTQGLRYAGDLVSTYWLAVPVVLLLGWRLAALRSLAPRGRWLAVVAVASGVAHAAYVTRLGGDFMHARLLLPSLFAVLLPVAVVVEERRRVRAILALAVAGWAIVCGLWLRVPYVGEIGPDGIADERGYYLKGGPPRVTLADYDDHAWVQRGRALRALAEERQRILMLDDGAVPGPPLDPRVRTDVVAGSQNVGLAGYAAGPRVHLVDRLGLGDPLAARLALTGRGRPGHERLLDEAWLIARFAAPSPADPEPVRQARAVLGCGRLADLFRAIESPLSAGRFLRNLQAAWSLDRLLVPADPVEAATALCVAAPPRDRSGVRGTDQPRHRLEEALRLHGLREVRLEAGGKRRVAILGPGVGGEGERWHRATPVERP